MRYDLKKYCTRDGGLAWYLAFQHPCANLARLGVVVPEAVLAQTLALHGNLALGVAKDIHLLESILGTKDLNRTAVKMAGHCKSPVHAGFEWFAVET